MADEKVSSTSTKDKKEENDEDQVKLQRVLGLPSCVSLIVGSIIGAGIFVNPTTIGRQLQSVGAVLVMWTLAGLYNILREYLMLKVSFCQSLYV